MSAREVLASVGLTADDVRRLVARHARPIPRPPEVDYSGGRFVRVIPAAHCAAAQDAGAAQ